MYLGSLKHTNPWRQKVEWRAPRAGGGGWGVGVQWGQRFSLEDENFLEMRVVIAAPYECN